MKLSERKWTCPECGKEHIRDHKAAINLKNYVPSQQRKLTSMDIENKYVKSLAILALESNSMDEVGTRVGDDSQNTPKSL